MVSGHRSWSWKLSRAGSDRATCRPGRGTRPSGPTVIPAATWGVRVCSASL